MAQSFLDIAGYPLGLRNNNPGNLRPLPGGQTWQGEIAPDLAHGFSRFSDISWGLRAMITDVAVSIVNDGNDTLTKLITRYSSTGQASYIARVSQLTGLGPDDSIPVTWDSITALIRAMINVELGAAYAPLISDQDISDAGTRLSSEVKGWLVPAGNTGSGGVAIAIAAIIAGLLLYTARR